MFCPKCGKPNKDGGNFCIHCGGSLISTRKVSEERASKPSQKVDMPVPPAIDPKKIQKWKANVKSAGLSSYAFGWLEIGVYTALTIWYLVDKNFGDSGLGSKINLGGWVLTAYIGLIFIVLGKRISKVEDKNIYKYLTVISVITLLMLALSIITQTGFGLIFILLLIAVIQGASAIGKLWKLDSFRAELKPIKNRITIPWWIGITIIAILAFFASSYYTPQQANSAATSNTNTAQAINTAWISYAAGAEKGNFTIQLPAQPTVTSDSQTAKDTGITALADTYESTGVDGTSYLVDYIHYAGEVDFSDNSTVLKSMLDGMVANSADNKLISSSNRRHIVYDALDFEVQNGIYTIKGRLVVKGKTAYRVIATQETSKFSSVDYLKFVNSLILN